MLQAISGLQPDTSVGMYELHNRWPASSVESLASPGKGSGSWDRKALRCCTVVTCSPCFLVNLIMPISGHSRLREPYLPKLLHTCRVCPLQ